MSMSSPQIRGAAEMTHTSFQIEEFRRPEYDVSNILFDENVIPTASAQYLAGGPLPMHPLNGMCPPAQRLYTAQ